MHQYSFVDIVTQVEWSPDGSLILVAIGKRSLVHVKSLTEEDWQCKIDEGIAGLAYARWGPNNNFVITISDFKVRMNVWGLADKSVQFIKNPKHDDERGVAFSPNKRLMALAEKSADGQAKDTIGIYEVSGNKWACLHHFNPDIFDLEDLKFSGDGQNLIVWDSALKCKMLVYQLQSGHGQAGNSIVACVPIAKFQPYQENSQLGIRSISVSSN
jgi:WD40 repeat protein